jgi:hypothetical protein
MPPSLDYDPPSTSQTAPLTGFDTMAVVVLRAFANSVSAQDHPMNLDIIVQHLLRTLVSQPATAEDPAVSQLECQQWRRATDLRHDSP